VSSETDAFESGGGFRIVMSTAMRPAKTRGMYRDEVVGVQRASEVQSGVVVRLGFQVPPAELNPRSRSCRAEPNLRVSRN
jgi:hypothetical protein